MTRRKKKRSQRKAQQARSAERREDGRSSTEEAPGGGARARREAPSVAVAAGAPGEALDSITGRILVVDDNPRYREAFTRHLLMEGFEVEQANDAQEALEMLGKGPEPDVVVTDLAMRTETEGLDLIHQARQRYPLLPIILISAVGTFEEGAEATRLGAIHVVSKMRIDTEIDDLITKIRVARYEHHRHRELLGEVRSIRAEALAAEDTTAGGNGDETAERLGRLQLLLGDDTLPAAIKSEAYDVLLAISGRQLQRDAAKSLESALEETGESGLSMAEIDDILLGELPALETLDPETLQSLRTAEFLYNQSHSTPEAIDFTRSIGFSYCFAVENQAKARMKKRLQKFLGGNSLYQLIPQLLERDGRHVNLFFHQHLLHATRGREMDITIDNVRLTLQRIMEHRSRYKPDGLKALGIVIICFGREYTFNTGKGSLRIDNPLGIRGLQDDHETLDYAELLISLQHYRNPFIHPEISEMEKISKIRRTSFDCLSYIQRLS